MRYRLCFYNPHVFSNTIGETIFSKVIAIIRPDKNQLKTHNRRHDYLLDLLRKPQQIPVAIVVDALGTSLDSLPSIFLPNFPLLRFVISSLEVRMWCLLNKINPNNISIITNQNKLNPKRDIVFSFGFCSTAFLGYVPSSYSIIKNYKGIKLVHLSHYYSNTARIANYLNELGFKYAVAEADLSNNSYFKKYFYFIKKCLVLPHVLRSKYHDKTTFNKRKNLCLALGTLVINDSNDPNNTDYFKHFHISTLHPMREAIYETCNPKHSQIYSLITVHNAQQIKLSQKSWFYRQSLFFRTIYNALFVSESKNYHDVDIVDTYNQFKMFVSPEENIGLPSINFIEGMACGCVYFGLKNNIYNSFGMKDGVSFIAYDGTIKNLIQKIKYYQNRPQSLAKIARKGQYISTTTFTQKAVLKHFDKELCRLM